MSCKCYFHGLCLFLGRAIHISWRQQFCGPGMSKLKVAQLCINSAWIALLIHNFSWVNAVLLIMCNTAFYAIIMFFSCNCHTIKGKGKDIRYKLYWSRNDKGTADVGVFVAEEWIEKVFEVQRVSDRIILVRLIVGQHVVRPNKRLCVFRVTF